MLLQYQTSTEQYWTESFSVTDEDVEFIFSLFLEKETPLTSREIARYMITHRVEQEAQKFKRQLARGEIFQPKNSYEIGQTLVFPSLDYAVGEIVDERDGTNPEHGPFKVIKVEFNGGRTHEFASELASPHQLNYDEDTHPADAGAAAVDVDALLDEFGDDIVYMIEERLQNEPDVVSFAGRWFLGSLLADVGVAHLHLAEAVLVMHDGGPLDTPTIMQEIEMPQEGNARLQTFSMDRALYEDPRFDEVGPAGQVLWVLRAMEPEEVQAIPEHLQYEPIEYDPRILTDELAALVGEIDDELSTLRTPSHPADEVTISLSFPHRRTGTLPLSSRLRHLFPTAYETPLILMTLVDGQTGEEMRAWVVRQHQYVFGLSDFYRRHKLPVGVYLTIKRTDDPARLIVDFDAYRPRTEWIRLAAAGTDNQLHVENQKRAIGAAYDELMIVGADDLKAVDDLWMPSGRSGQALPELMRHLMSELSRLSPQRTVHAKTLYSLVNVVKRCPPGPIFAHLVARPEFEHVGGPYWRLSAR